MQNSGILGVLGSEINRMNEYTIQKALKGFIYYIEKNAVNYKDRGVVIGYSSETMTKEFADEAARFLGCHGIKAYVFKKTAAPFLVSFAVRYLGAVAGVMIASSSNRGFTIYNDTGSRFSSEEENELIDYINRIENEIDITELDEQQLVQQNKFQLINDGVTNAYLEQLIKSTKMDGQRLVVDKHLPIILTSLHETSKQLIKKGLAQLHFNDVYISDERSREDLKHSEEVAFNAAVQRGRSLDAELIFVIDHNGAKLTVAVKDTLRDYRKLSSNELGALLLDYLLMHTRESFLYNAKVFAPDKLGCSIAHAYGVKLIESNFNDISNKINDFDATGETFIVGYSDRNEYIFNQFVRDKDAVQAAVITCELAYFWKRKGISLLDVLEKLQKRYHESVGGLP